LGISYAVAGQTWTILKGISVSGTLNAVDSDFGSSTLVNRGEVTGDNYGVKFDPQGAPGNLAVENTVDGQILGGIAGIFFDQFANAGLIQNRGEIGGEATGILTFGTSNVEIINRGEVTSNDKAIHIGYSAGAAGTEITNLGKIEGTEYGIYIAGNIGLAAEIDNREGGVIESDGYAVRSMEKLELVNRGKIDGFVLANFHDDEVINRGKIKGDVDLGGGDDLFKNIGSASSGVIDASGGNDIVVLGDKKDTLLFDSILSAASNVDTIRQFTSGKDNILLDEDFFLAMTRGTLSASEFHKGTAATDFDQRIIYDKQSGALYYDLDGIGAGFDQIQFATLGRKTKLEASDFSVGEFSI
jgi:hypothetical protein